MAENKMEQVAAMFGKKLGEEFDVRFNGKLKCLTFDEQRGLLYFNGDEWRKNYAYLDWLVRGKAVIVDDKTFIVFVLASIAGVTAGYSEDLFRAIVATGIVWIHHDILRK